MSNFYTVKEFSQVLGLHTNTVYKGIREGKIIALRLTNGKNAVYRIPKTELERIAIVDLKKVYETLEE
jgi:excisionase family DNA binding protein